MLYIGYLMILDGQNIKKNQFRKFPFFELLRQENCISKLCPSPIGSPPPPTRENWDRSDTGRTSP